jgi:hypothetical protein
MMVRCVCSFIVVLWGTTAQAKLEIGNIQAAYGVFGPERKSLVYHPNDEILFRWLLTGVKTNAKGEVDIAILVQIANADGEVLMEKTSPLKGVAALGGGCAPAYARATIAEALGPGTYHVRVKAKDNLSGDVASFERGVTLNATEFTSVAQGFFLDADGNVPSAAGGVLGQHLHYRLGVIGFDRSKGRIETHFDLEILDENGKEVLTRPFKDTYKVDEAASAKRISLITFKGSFGLNRPGKFTLRFNFTDPIGAQNARFEVPLHVTQP